MQQLTGEVCHFQDLDCELRASEAEGGGSAVQVVPCTVHLCAPPNGLHSRGDLLEFSPSIIQLISSSARLRGFLESVEPSLPQTIAAASRFPSAARFSI